MCIHIHISLYISLSIYIHSYIYIYIHLYIHTPIYIYNIKSIHMCVYIYIYIYTYVHIHLYTMNRQEGRWLGTHYDVLKRSLPVAYYVMIFHHLIISNITLYYTIYIFTIILCAIVLLGMFNSSPTPSDSIRALLLICFWAALAVADRAERSWSSTSTNACIPVALQTFPFSMFSLQHISRFIVVMRSTLSTCSTLQRASCHDCLTKGAA